MDNKIIQDMNCMSESYNDLAKIRTNYSVFGIEDDVNSYIDNSILVNLFINNCRKYGFIKSKSLSLEIKKYLISMYDWNLDNKIEDIRTYCKSKCKSYPVRLLDCDPLAEGGMEFVIKLFTFSYCERLGFEFEHLSGVGDILNKRSFLRKTVETNCITNGVSSNILDSDSEAISDMAIDYLLKNKTYKTYYNEPNLTEDKILNGDHIHLIFLNDISNNIYTKYTVYKKICLERQIPIIHTSQTNQNTISDSLKIATKYFNQFGSSIALCINLTPIA